MPLKRWLGRGRKWDQKAEWKRNIVNYKKGGKNVSGKEGNLKVAKVLHWQWLVPMKESGKLYEKPGDAEYKRNKWKGEKVSGDIQKDSNDEGKKTWTTNKLMRIIN